MRMAPALGSSSPAIMRSVVVLPQPDGPSRQKNSPSSTVKLDGLRAWKGPKRFSRSRTAICAMVYSGNLVTIMNISVPIAVTAKE